MLIALIPIVGLYLIYLLAKDSDAGQNQYGQEPEGHRLIFPPGRTARRSPLLFPPLDRG